MSDNYIDYDEVLLEALRERSGDHLPVLAAANLDRNLRRLCALLQRIDERLLNITDVLSEMVGPRR